MSNPGVFFLALVFGLGYGCAHAQELSPQTEVKSFIQINQEAIDSGGLDLNKDSFQVIPFEFNRVEDSSLLDPILKIIPRRDPYDPLTQMSGTGPIFSAQLLDQAGLAAGFGWLFGKKQQLDQVVEDGLVLEVKGSIAGGQVAIGKRERIWAVFFPLDYSLKVGYLANWNGLRIAGNLQDKNYFGMEADFDLFFSRLSFAAYRSTYDSHFEDPRSWVGILNWGFSDK